MWKIWVLQKFLFYLTTVLNLSYSFMFFWFFFLPLCIWLCMFCILLFNSVSYVFFFILVPCILILLKYFYSPTDAQVNCLKNNFKIYIKTVPTYFGAVTPSSVSALLVLAKVTVKCWWIKTFIMYSYCYVYVFLLLCKLCSVYSTLTEVFPWFFLSCKVNARV